MTLDELERLERIATPGPWQFEYAASWTSGKREITEWFVRLDGDDVAIAADIIDPRNGDQPSETNARLIAAARNALPALLRLARCVAEERDAARAGNGATNEETARVLLDNYIAATRKTLDALAALEAIQ